jgi:hypothetical protein
MLGTSVLLVQKYCRMLGHTTLRASTAEQDK